MNCPVCKKSVLLCFNHTAHGLVECDHCHGYGSSFKDDVFVERCTKCGGSGLLVQYPRRDVCRFCGALLGWVMQPAGEMVALCLCESDECQKKADREVMVCIGCGHTKATGHAEDCGHIDCAPEQEDTHCFIRKGEIL